MASPTSLLKRLLVGRPFRSDRLQHTLLSKRIALPVFASDALSSVAYAPDEILLTLSIAGASAFLFSPWVALAVVVVMLTVVASYRQNVHAYPSGGGDYEVATVNLGPRFGVGVASALLVDYILTVAVSTSSGVANLGSVLPWVAEHKVGVALTAVALLTAANLRGLRESGTAFAIPTYGFMIVILGMIVTGLIRIFVLGDHLLAPSAGLEIRAEHNVTGAALVFLLLRTFSSGCAALTGVEAISNGVPAFKPPKSRNAATTLLLLGVVAISMLVGIVTLARLTHLQFVESSAQIVDGPAGYVQKTVTTQLGETVFGSGSVLLYVVAGMTALILFLAANTAFNGFPVLGSILAQDRYLPRQLHTRGDRLAFSNGIVALAVFAGVLIVAYQAEVTRLVNLYIVGVFVSFTLSQAGMIRHWNRLLRSERDAGTRSRMIRSRAINAFGMVLTGVVLVIVLITKFALGAWIAIVAMGIAYALMLGIRRHYDTVARELAPADEGRPVLPARNHAIVLVSKVHQPTMRAIAYATATRPDTLTAVTVNVDEKDTRKLQQEWERRGIPVPLTVVDSPYREITRPILDFVASARRNSPRDVVTVFIPEYVVGKWWENLLHNQSALRLKGRLLFEPGVMVTSVPWQLESTATKNLDRFDATLTRGPARGPRGAMLGGLLAPPPPTPEQIRKQAGVDAATGDADDQPASDR
ncbi:APC family permease [Micromonospora zhanjiangensis]|uniref:APC family permease n=1 Tax=Micromonospora zhanjiangensis TaxID=1522057 RepID=A0ABV8KGV2_9ACTN